MAISPIKDRYNEILNFLQTWIPLYLPSAGLYLVGQAAPRPPTPYVAFNPLSDVEYVGNDERRIDDAGNETLRGQRIITFDLFAYTDSETRHDGEDNAWEMLQELRFSLNYPEVKDLLSAITCRVVNEGMVTNVSETLNTTNQPQAVLQVTLSTVIVQDIDNGAIEIVNGEGSMGGSNNTFTSDISVTKP